MNKGDTVGKRIRMLREGAGMTGEKFGEICGVSKSLVSLWEKDGSQLTLVHLLALQERLSFDFNWLLLGVGDAPGTARPENTELRKVAQKIAEYAVEEIKKVSNGDR